uniref:Uncharacterized protein n=1 Tax=Alexandrium catenella TaxID=2925 RepID=A0A7S1S461_ALECA
MVSEDPPSPCAFSPSSACCLTHLANLEILTRTRPRSSTAPNVSLLGGEAQGGPFTRAYSYGDRPTKGLERSRSKGGGSRLHMAPLGGMALF